MAKNVSKANQETRDLLATHGWVNDPYSYRSTPGFGRNQELDPHAYVKPAKHGGQWRLELDYKARNTGGWSTSYGTTLNGAEVQHIPADAVPEFNQYIGKDLLHGKRVGQLSRPSKYDSYNGLNVFLTGTLRERIHQVITDPDVTLWLAWEAEAADRARRTAQFRADEERRNNEAGPLRHVELEGHGYGSDWGRKASALNSAAQKLRDADGTTDVITLLVDAALNFGELVNALTDEGRAELFKAYDVKARATDAQNLDA